jgi:hypothetical protein
MVDSSSSHLDEPAERRDPGRDGLELVERRAALHEGDEAHAADAGRVQPLQFRFVDVGFDGADTACAIEAQARDRIDQAPIVGPVDAGLDHHHPFDADGRGHREIGGFIAAGARRVTAPGRQRIARRVAEDVEVGVAQTPGRRERRRVMDRARSLDEVGHRCLFRAAAQVVAIGVACHARYFH